MRMAMPFESFVMFRRQRGPRMQRRIVPNLVPASRHVLCSLECQRSTIPGKSQHYTNGFAVAVSFKSSVAHELRSTDLDHPFARHRAAPSSNRGRKITPLTNKDNSNSVRVI